MGEATLVKKDKRGDADLQDHWRLNMGLKWIYSVKQKSLKGYFDFFLNVVQY